MYKCLHTLYKFDIVIFEYKIHKMCTSRQLCCSTPLYKQVNLLTCPHIQGFNQDVIDIVIHNTWQGESVLLQNWWENLIDHIWQSPKLYSIYTIMHLKNHAHLPCKYLWSTIYANHYVHGLSFDRFRGGLVSVDFTHIFQGYTSLALGQPYDCPTASGATLKDMGK